MGSLPKRIFRTLTLVLAIALPAASLRAAEIDRYLPEDTEAVSTLNIKQLLNSPLVKKYALKHMMDALQGIDEVTGVLKDLDFDPFKDLDRIITASPGGGDQDKGLIIVRGRFDLAKFKAKGEEAAKDNSESLKIHKVPDGQGGHFLVYEVTPSELPMPLFVALAGRDTLLGSFGKDYVVDALKRKDKPVLKDKDFQAMLEKMDGRATWGMALVKNAWAKAELPDPVKEALDNVEAIGGSLTVGDDINLELVANTKNAKAAKDINQKINDGINTGLAILAGLATQNKDLMPLVDIAKSVKSTARDKTITIKVSVSAEMIENAFKKKDD